MGLTELQAKLLAFIAQQITETNVAPSFPEMAIAIGRPPGSKSVIFHMLNALEDKGRIRRLRNRARSIEVMGPQSNCPHCGHRLGSNACQLAADASVITYSKTRSLQAVRA